MNKKVTLKEVRCPECGTINDVPLHRQGGTITIFCKNCGEEIHLTLSRTLLDMELKRPPINQQEND